MTIENGIVSILMPAKNSETSLRSSVESVLKQSFLDWELIIIDDGSEDATRSIAEDLVKSDNRIQLVKLSDSIGAAGARNIGLDVAKGRYIAFLDSDDLWLPQKLEQQIAFMKKQTVALSYSSYHRVAESGQLIETMQVPEEISYKDLLKHNIIGCSTAVYDTQVYGKPLMPDFVRHHDYALWLVLMRLDKPVMGIAEPLAIYRVGRNSLSTNKVLGAPDLWRVYRHHQKLPLIQACWCFARYAVFVLRQRVIQTPRPKAPFLDELIR